MPSNPIGSASPAQPDDVEHDGLIHLLAIGAFFVFWLLVMLTTWIVRSEQPPNAAQATSRPFWKRDNDPNYLREELSFLEKKSIFHVGDVPYKSLLQYRADKQSSDPARLPPKDLVRWEGKVGYFYGYDSRWFVRYWTHSGCYCLYKGKHYNKIEIEEAARLLNCSKYDLSPPFFYRIPWSWFIPGPVLGIAFLCSAMSLFYRRRKEAEARAYQFPG